MLGIGLEDGAGELYSGVVHQDVQPAGLGRNVRDETLELRCIADIEGRDRCTTAGSLDRRLGLPHQLACATDQKDMRALAAEQLGDRATHAARCAGDDRGTPCERGAQMHNRC